MVTMMNQKWRIILGICLVMMVCVPMVSAALQISTIKHSYSRPSFEQVRPVKDIPYISENNRMQSHRMDSGPTSDELLDNLLESLRMDPGLPYTAINEPIPVKCLLFSVNSPNVYSQKIDGYYYYPGLGYIPHIKLTPIS